MSCAITILKNKLCEYKQTYKLYTDSYANDVQKDQRLESYYDMRLVKYSQSIEEIENAIDLLEKNL